MKELSPYYLKYKKFLLPAALIFLIFFLVFRVILPQLSSIGDLNQEIFDKNQKNASLQNSLSAISNQNQDTLSSDLDTATQALPTSKNIAFIFDALSAAATAAGTDLKEFSLKVGGLYGRAEKVSSNNVGVPTVDVIVRIGGADATSIAQFTKEIQQRLPLAEVKTIDATGSLSTLEVSFFYKPLDLFLLSKKENVAPISQADLNLLSQLKGWGQ